MESTTIKLRNARNNKLDVLISGNENASTAIVFAHGFGSNKNENFNLFVDIAASLEKDFRIIRFDFSGYGESEGEQKDVNLDTMKDDLATVVEYTKGIHKKVFIVAHSMGTFATILLKPLGIERIVFTSPPNSNTKLLIENIQARIEKNGGRVNEKGTTYYNRSNGDKQVIGSSFWETMRGFNPVGHTKFLSHYSSLAIFEPQNDEVVAKGSDLSHYISYGKLGIKCKDVPGDHNFTHPEDRSNLIAEINHFFRKVKMVFIAHPISGDVENNIQKVINISEEIHSETIVPVFPSLLWRKYLGHKSEHTPLIKVVNDELFKRKAIDEVWFFGDSISNGMKGEIQLAVEYGIPTIGKVPKMAFELTKEVDVE